MFYFSKYEDRLPRDPLEYSESRQTAYRILSIINIIFGTWYITWRWTASLNYDELAFALTLVIAETASFIAMLLFTYNLWTDEKISPLIPPKYFSECLEPNNPNILRSSQRIINVDILITTYNEEAELVRLSVIHAKKLQYQYDINIKIYVLDDSNRQAMRAMAAEEQVEYINRQYNIGFKAGNLANGMLYTYGDFIVICDADTRLFPDFLSKTLGFFRDPLVAWVQTPQWFFDLHPGVKPSQFGAASFGKIGKFIGLGLEKIFKMDKVMADPFYSDSTTFFDLILRRRNAHNASFCCGAGSIHRREALYEVAVEYYASQCNKEQDKNNHIFSPFKFHISEDIYTSSLIHSAKKKKWKSIFYPEILSKMLSPQDFQARYNQLYRYATGTLDFAFKELLLKKSSMTIAQKLSYFTTFYSYISSIWHLIFLIAPIFYLFTEIAPVGTTYQDFLKHLIPYVLINEITQMVGCNKINKFNDKVLSMGCFWINLKALYSVLLQKKMQFNVTSKTPTIRKNYTNFAFPHFIILIMGLGSIIYSLTKVYKGDILSPAGALIINYIWLSFNLYILWKIILSSMWTLDEHQTKNS